MDYTLGIGNSGISGTPGPYGTVDVNLTSSTTAVITFTASSGFLFTDGGSAAVNVNAGHWTIGSFSTIPNGIPLTDGGAGNEDGWGSFNQTVNNPNSSPADRASTITFTLTDTSGTWADAAAVLTGNASGYFAAAHIYINSGSGSGNTGFAADGTPSTPSVPDGGATIALLGFGLVGIDLLRRRFAKA